MYCGYCYLDPCECNGFGGPKNEAPDFVATHNAHYGISDEVDEEEIEEDQEITMEDGTPSTVND